MIVRNARVQPAPRAVWTLLAGIEKTAGAVGEEELGRATLRRAPHVTLRRLRRSTRSTGDRCGQCDACAGAVAVLGGHRARSVLPRLIGPVELSLLDGSYRSIRRRADPLPEQLPSLIRRLVLDGALHLRRGREFVTGFEASFLLPDPTDASQSTISTRAMAYGASLPPSDVPSLAARLYGFNRLPITSRWRQAFGSPYDVLNYLGLSPSSPIRRSLERGWALVDSDPDSAWIRWRRRGHQGTDDDHLFKIYVSLQLTNLPAELPVVVDTLMSTPVSSFKFGADADSLLRPDNLVLYCRSMADLRTIVARLVARVRTTGAQGVPFSSPARQDHAVSWGIDPPVQFCQTRGESWRSWIALRVAEYLACAARTGAGADAQRVRFALGRLALDGVDVTHWRPSVFVSGKNVP